MAEKRALLFYLALVLSLLLTSALGSFPLVKRGVVVTWAKALSRGQASLCLLPTAKPPSQWTQFDQLAQNGWNQDNTISNTGVPPSDLSDALTGSSLSTSAAPWTLSYMLQDGNFPMAGGRNGLPTYGYYENIYNPTQGAIIATQNFGPRFMDSNPTADIPALEKWSDVVGLNWQKICSTAKVNPNKIQYFFRWHINNDSGTRDIINQALGGEENLHTWPGTKFMTSTTNGQALLGSAHGNGIVFFLTQHQAALGKKTVDYITAFQTYTGEYSLMFHITNV